MTPRRLRRCHNNKRCSMKAVVMREKKLEVASIADPVPAQGELLVKTLACGICGSDLHMYHHCELVLENFKRGNLPIDFDAKQDVVFGHEFCGEVLDHGPGSDKKLKVGTKVCSLPFVIRDNLFHHVGYSNQYPGGYGEQMVLADWSGRHRHPQVPRHRPGSRLRLIAQAPRAGRKDGCRRGGQPGRAVALPVLAAGGCAGRLRHQRTDGAAGPGPATTPVRGVRMRGYSGHHRSEEHTSELQS